MTRVAEFSADRKHRYFLSRVWDENKPMVMFVGLNPSKADEFRDDNTVTRCIRFAAKWGYGGMYMTNLFAYVSTDPQALITSGEDLYRNDITLRRCAKNSQQVIFAWGAFKLHAKRMETVKKMFPDAYCLGLTKGGFPRHPLYLPNKTIPIKLEKH